MIERTQPTSAPIGDRETEVESALGEVIAEFGLKSVIAAALRNGAAEQMQMGGDATLRVIQVMIRQIVYADDPQLEAEVIALGAGVILADDSTQRKIGEKHGLTRAAVSKRVLAFCDANGLPPSIYMKPAAARGVYALTNQPRSA